MAVRKPIVILNDNHLSELQTGDGLMSYLDPGTTTLSQLIQAMLDAGVIAAEVLGPPVNISAPVVTGASFVGDTASTTNGTWSGGAIIEYEYLWQENDGSWENVLGETNNTFADMPIGQFRSAVRARNDAGWSDWAYSSAFMISEPSAGLVFDGPASANAILSAGDTLLSHSGSGGDLAIAWIDAAIVGKVYLEVRCIVVSRENTVNFTGDGEKPISTDTVPALVWDTPRGMFVVGGWSSFVRANYGMGAPNEVSGAHEYYDQYEDDLIARVCIDATTRQVWVCTFGHDFAGDPAAGTGATFILNGVEPIYISAVVADGDTMELLSPDNHSGTAPAGFTPI